MPLSLDDLLQSVPTETSPKPKPIENAKTLYTFHNQQIDKLKNDKTNLEELKAELAIKVKRLEEVEHEFTGLSLIQTASDIHMLTSCSKLEKEIQDLKEKISQIETGADVENYFLRVGDILFSYSDAQERIAGGERPTELNKKVRVPANSVYSYFAPDNSDAPSIDLKDKEKEHDRVKSVQKASDISNTIGFKRDKALETFLSALNPDSLHHDVAVADIITEDYGNCPVCDTEMFLNETFLDCPGCGFRDMILIDSEKPSYKDPPREMSYYAYKKINHLNEWLAQFQAKETTEISQAVLEQIRAELRKDRITDMSKLKPSKLKEVIKKLKLNRCYDHIAHVLNRLNGISAPVLSREVEEKLRFMFKEIQFSFVKHCPKKRSNFLSYSFVLYKFCELLELDEYLPCFPLLKSREKLYMQDKIWQKICEDMGWEFIRTV
jgi:hypothetical protein